jgi:hypothetical protein
MKERVSIIHARTDGLRQMLLVAPHGTEDLNTSTITEKCADELGCHAIINRGFERSSKVDVLHDKADCHKVSHVIQDVVSDEFLSPIKRIVDRVITRIVKYSFYMPTQHSFTSERMFVFYIYGIGNVVHKMVNDEVSVIIGNGGNMATCQNWRRDAFVNFANSYWNPYVSPGRYSGGGYDNMNQYFKQHEPNSFVETMQFQFPLSTRNTIMKAEDTGETLALILSRVAVTQKFNKDIELNTI